MPMFSEWPQSARWSRGVACRTAGWWTVQSAAVPINRCTTAAATDRRPVGWSTASRRTPHISRTTADKSSLPNHRVLLLFLQRVRHISYNCCSVRLAHLAFYCHTLGGDSLGISAIFSRNTALSCM